MTLQQFAKYGLLRLGAGQDFERIDEVLSLKPKLKPPQ